MGASALSVSSAWPAAAAGQAEVMDMEVVAPVEDAGDRTLAVEVGGIGHRRFGAGGGGAWAWAIKSPSSRAWATPPPLVGLFQEHTRTRAVATGCISK
jgi:hypothetical protein